MEERVLADLVRKGIEAWEPSGRVTRPRFTDGRRRLWPWALVVLAAVTALLWVAAMASGRAATGVGPTAKPGGVVEAGHRRHPSPTPSPVGTGHASEACPLTCL